MINTGSISFCLEKLRDISYKELSISEIMKGLEAKISISTKFRWLNKPLTNQTKISLKKKQICLYKKTSKSIGLLRIRKNKNHLLRYLSKKFNMKYKEKQRLTQKLHLSNKWPKISMSLQEQTMKTNKRNNILNKPRNKKTILRIQSKCKLVLFQKNKNTPKVKELINRQKERK